MGRHSITVNLTHSERTRKSLEELGGGAGRIGVAIAFGLTQYIKESLWAGKEARG